MRPTSYACAAGFFFGTAISVKYPGWYFAAGALAFLALFGARRRRAIPLFLIALLAAALPTVARTVALTGNPVFPFMPKAFGQTPWTILLPERLSPGARIVRALRLFWDVTFARERVNWQPPFSPLIAVAFVILLLAAFRSRRAALLALICAGYAGLFTFLPQDSRYLLSLLPLLSAAAAAAIVSALGTRPAAGRIAMALTIVAVAPAFAYAAYRLAHLGLPPVTATERRVYLEERIPEYRALERRGAGRIYVCGAEQLKYFGGSDLLGDVVGPFSTEKVLGSRSAGDVSRLFARLGVHYLLVSRSACAPQWQRLPEAPLFERIYADGGAVLWRVAPPTPRTESR